MRFYKETWERLGANSFIMKIISGTRIPFSAKPPLVTPTTSLRKLYHTKPSPEMTKMIEQLKDQGVLEKPAHSDPGFLSRMFIIPKTSGGLRPIVDLRGLNAFVITRHFQLISHASVPDFLQKEDWMTKVDISNAYLHVPIRESHRRFLRLVYKDELLQLTALPFGLASSPRTFAALTNWIAEILRSRGYRVVVYLDDFLIANQDRNKLTIQAAEAIHLLESLGWHINYQKCKLDPTQQLEYLGIMWNTQNNTKFIAENKVKKIRNTIRELLAKPRCNLRQTQSILGQLNFANFVVPNGRLHCRNLQIFTRQLSRYRKAERRPLPLWARQDLQWWMQSVRRVTPLHQKSITHFLTTDAADAGWGAQLNETLMAGKWTQEQMKWHSNLKELFAVYAAIRRQSHNLTNTRILIQSDNRTLVAYIRNEGGTQSLNLLKLTSRLLKLADSLNIVLSAQYLPGRFNCLADHLSRGRRLPEWHLLPAVTDKLFQYWGTPDVDLFASRATAVVRRYVSLDCQDKSALFLNAFSRHWHFNLGWIFPPPNLMPRVLAHLNKASGRYIIIAPQWEKTFWMTDLQSRALEKPRLIKDLKHNLRDMSTNRAPPQIDQLILQAWLVGGGEKTQMIGH